MVCIVDEKTASRELRGPSFLDNSGVQGVALTFGARKIEISLVCMLSVLRGK